MILFFTKNGTNNNPKKKQPKSDEHKPNTRKENEKKQENLISDKFDDHKNEKQNESIPILYRWWFLIKWKDVSKGT